MQLPAEADLPVLGGSRIPSRRHFVVWFFAATAAAVARLSPGRAHSQMLLGAWLHAGHPDPRPGIDGSRVLTAAQLDHAPHLIDVFDGIREIPHIADGLLCYCGCAHVEGYRSLLTCYEKPGMAQYCEICEGQGRLAYRRWKEGQTLDQIRRATDARYGPDAGAGRAKPNVLHAHDHV
jgi:hypothetical protein